MIEKPETPGSRIVKTSATRRIKSLFLRTLWGLIPSGNLLYQGVINGELTGIVLGLLILYVGLWLAEKYSLKNVERVFDETRDGILARQYFQIYPDNELSALVKPNIPISLFKPIHIVGKLLAAMDQRLDDVGYMFTTFVAVIVGLIAAIVILFIAFYGVTIATQSLSIQGAILVAGFLIAIAIWKRK